MSDPTPATDSPAMLNQRQLEVLRPLPAGAVALSAIAVLLLLLAWLLIYLVIYLPRGPVG